VPPHEDKNKDDSWQSPEKKLREAEVKSREAEVNTFRKESEILQDRLKKLRANVPAGLPPPPEAPSECLCNGVGYEAGMYMDAATLRARADTSSYHHNYTPDASNAGSTYDQNYSPNASNAPSTYNQNYSPNASIASSTQKHDHMHDASKAHLPYYLNYTPHASNVPSTFHPNYTYSYV